MNEQSRHVVASPLHTTDKKVGEVCGRRRRADGVGHVADECVAT